MQAETPANDSSDYASNTLAVDTVEQGVQQYTQLLDSADSTAIAIILTLWQANNVQMLANLRAIASLDVPVVVTGSRLTILRTLYFAPEKRMALSAISKSTGISPTMVTNLVDGLSRGCLVQREGNPNDRRVTMVRLTSEGEAAFHKVLPVMSARMTEACRHLSGEEKQQLLTLLRRLL